MNKINILLFILTLASAFAVVTVQDRSRQSFIAVEKAKHERADLESEYRLLRWQQAQLANRASIKEVAAQQNLYAPNNSNTQIIHAEP